MTEHATTDRQHHCDCTGGTDGEPDANRPEREDRPRDGRPDAPGDETTGGQAIPDDVRSALRGISGPEGEVSLLQDGLVGAVDVSEGRATVEADLSGFPPADARAVSQRIVESVSAVEGIEDVQVEHAVRSPGSGSSTRHGANAADVDRSVGLAAADRVVAVASAKGGVGKSTVAVSIARALAAEGQRVGIFDADVYGPNVPELLDVTGPVHSDDEGNPIPVAVTGDDDGTDQGRLEAMSVGLLQSGGPLAWRGAMVHDALTELLTETAWADPDTVVLDLPPGTGDVALTTLQETSVDGVVFVTTPFHAAVSDTVRSLRLFEENDVPVLGAVSNMGEFVCENCGEPHDLFEGPDPLSKLDVPVLAEIPFDPEMQSPAGGGSGSATGSAPDAGSGSLPDHARRLGDAVRERIEEIWTVEIPDNGVDLRGTPPDERHELVAAAFADVDPGEEFYVVSDRDPSPVRGFLLDLVEGDRSFETFEVRRQNPETFVLRTERP